MVKSPVGASLSTVAYIVSGLMDFIGGSTKQTASDVENAMTELGWLDDVTAGHA